MTMSNISLRRTLALWLPPVAVAAAIFILSATPDLKSPLAGILDLLARKAGHLGIYWLLGFSLQRGLEGSAKVSRRLMVIGISLVIVFAVSDEYHQSFVPGRSGSAVDIVIDVIGGSLGLVAWQGLFKEKAKSTS